MAQSDIQSYLQSLTGIHSQSQANVPSGVNNGNPNTVYNVTPSQGGYLPPVTNAYDQWRINPGGGVNWQQLAMQGGFGNGPTFDLSGIAPKPTSPSTPPLPGNGGTPPQTGGGLPPTPVPGTGGGTGGGGGGGPTPTGGGGTGTLTGGLSYFDNRISGGKGAGWGLIPQQAFSDAFTDKPSSGGGTVTWSKDSLLQSIGGLGDTNINLGSFGQSLANSPLGRALGVSADGTFDLAQALDWVLPGNLYMAQTGEMNPANIIPALFKAINPLLGMGVAKLMDHYGAKYENTPDEQLNPLQRMVKHRYVKNKKNFLAGRGGANPGAGQGASGGFGGPFVPSFDANGNKIWVYDGGPRNGMPVSPGDMMGAILNGNNGIIPGSGFGGFGAGTTTGGSTTSGSGDGDLQLHLPEFRISQDFGPVKVAHGPDGSTHGFQMAFAGGSDMPDVRNFVNDLRTKGGFATK